MKIDVVIATYNRSNLILDTINNILRFKNDFGKFFIINNNSTDNTKSILDSIDDEQVEVIHMDKNLGAPGGKNIGLKKSNADVIVVLDDDAVFFTENPIKEVSKIFQRNVKVGIIQFKIVNYDLKKVLGYEFPGENPEKYQDTEFETGYFIGAGHAIRKQLLEKCGYYPDDFFYAHEEVDLSYRAINAGYIIKYCPVIGVYHKKFPGGRLTDKEVIMKSYKNRLVMSYAYLPFKYRIITNFLWFLKTIRDSFSLTIPIRAIQSFWKIKNEIKTQRLTRGSIKYLKKNNGRLYK